MEFTITKEQILEVAKWGDSQNEKQIKEWFPEAFESELKIGKWYKGIVDSYKSLICITMIQKMGNYNRIFYYGFFNNKYENSSCISNKRHENSLVEATKQELREALISEAKKRGFINGSKVKRCLLDYGENVMVNNKGFDFNDNELWVRADVEGSNICIFKDGIWSEIIPKEKTTISKEKALKILAKKLKVSPENIEIK